MVNVGEFRDFIEIQDFKDTINNNGFQEKGWVTFVKTRSAAKVPSLRKQEVIKDLGIQTVRTMEFTFRYIPGLDYGQRILYKGDQWDIKGIENPDRRNRYHSVLCELVEV